MIPYILNVGLVLTCCLSFYKLLLKKETFYKANRYMLMVCLMIAFGLPLLHVPQQFSLRKTPTVATGAHPILPANNIEANRNTDTNKTTPALRDKQAENAGSSLTFGKLIQWIIALYWFGVIVFALNFLVQIIILLYRAYSNPVIKDGSFRIVEVRGDKAPCSFANNIFINPEKYDWDVYNQIIEHEKIHIRQKHSLDILFTELVLILQWFNPFAWLYRKEVESNLEFLTDDQLLQKENVEKSSYQLNLLKVSVPHFPLSLTTNYNQSLLKKRITMMNTKKSSVHTAWKYFFLLPLLIVLASVLNEPIAKAQDNKEPVKGNAHHRNDFKTEGYWFATIKGDKVKMRFTQDEDDHDSYNGSEFLLSDFANLPREAKGDFKLTREAGTMNFNGKFEGNQGMGRYKFEPNKDFENYMTAQGIGKLDEDDIAGFFFLNITKEYLQMVKDEGFRDIKKDNLMAMCALKVDKGFISSIRANGYNDIDPDKLISFKALGITGTYIKEIKDAGYKDISSDQLISFKAQGIDKDYLSKLPKTNFKGNTLTADNVVSLKALNVDADYTNSFKALGYENIDPEELVSMKSVGVTPDYVKEFQSLGYKNIFVENLISMKAQNITAQFVKEFEDEGYKNLSAENLVSMKAVGVTPGYVKEFQSLGYKNISAEDLVSMKAQNITVQFVKAFKDIGYANIPEENLISLKAVGVQPDFIKSFKEKGYNTISFEEAVSLKSQNITPEFLDQFAAVGYKNISLDDAVALKATGVTADWIKEMKAKGFNYTDVRKYITLKSLQ